MNDNLIEVAEAYAQDLDGWGQLQAARHIRTLANLLRATHAPLGMLAEYLAAVRVLQATPMDAPGWHKRFEAAQQWKAQLLKLDLPYLGQLLNPRPHQVPEVRAEPLTPEQRAGLQEFIRSPSADKLIADLATPTPTAVEAMEAVGITPPPTERERELEAQKDGAYAERNHLVAALSKLFPASVEEHQVQLGEDWDPEWLNVVFIDLPTGQVSWHIHVAELEQFAHLPRNAGRAWDGHTTPEKYARLAALRPQAGEL